MVSILLASVVIIESLIIVEGNKIEKEEVDYLIVLGARLYGETPSASLLERLKVAHQYLEAHTDRMVVVSGGQGQGEDVAEGYAMAQYLANNGIEPSRIIIEDQSTNTFENLSFSLEKIRKNDNKENLTILIATNKYHIFRSKMLAKRLGMIPYGLPAKIPPISIFKSYAREYFAVIKSLLCDKWGEVSLSPGTWIAIYMPIFIIFFIILPEQRHTQKLMIKKKKNKKGAMIMTNTMLKKYIGKNCRISTGSFGTNVNGTIIDINENWIELETSKKTELINTEFIQSIKII